MGSSRYGRIVGWTANRLAEIKEVGVTAVLAAIDALNKQVRAPAKRKSLASLRECLVTRLDMLDYRTALAKGWDIGSGPTEATCKMLTLRLKQSGMKWDRDNAAAMMNLTALYDSGQAKSDWQTRRSSFALFRRFLVVQSHVKESFSQGKAMIR